VQVAAKPSELGPLEGHMDLVLVDAPCTGSGTWRRRPDAKWRLSDRQLAARVAEQQSILDAAARYVKPGGRLVYVTCSIFAEENAAQIRAFRERMPAFSPIDHEAAWRDAFGATQDMAHVDASGGIGLSPLRTGTDGFYVAILKRS
jgi:16S rRNA (cytosine967-C5)-methyltransferase